MADTCSLTATTALAFGTIDASTNTSETTPGVVQVLCTGPHVGVSVTMDGGDNPSGGVRYMSDGGSNTLPYFIYSDAGHSGAVAEGGTIFSGNISANVAQNIQVFGQVPSGTYDAGNYSDVIVVTLTY